MVVQSVQLLAWELIDTVYLGAKIEEVDLIVIHPWVIDNGLLYV